MAILSAESTALSWCQNISDVAIASAYSDKICLKKLITIMNKSQESMVFSGHQKLTSVMKLRPEK